MQTVKDIGRRVMNWLFGRRQKHHLEAPPASPARLPTAREKETRHGWQAPKKITRQMVARRIFMPEIWNNIATLADGTQYSMQPDGWRRLTPRRHERT